MRAILDDTSAAADINAQPGIVGEARGARER